jgi:hypothetical protein
MGRCLAMATIYWLVINKSLINTVIERFEVFMAVTMKVAVFWDVMPCVRSVCWLRDTADVPSSPIFATFLRNVCSYKSHMV